MSKRQQEIDGFQRETIAAIDSAIAAKLDVEARMKLLKSELEAAVERVDFRLESAGIELYRYVDGELVIDVSRNEQTTVHYRVVSRPRKQPETGENG